MLKLKKMSPESYFINDEKLLHQIVTEDDKIFHPLVLPQTLIKYVLHQVHDMLGHNGTVGTYQYLK